MNTNIKATNIELTPAISDYVAKRLQSLEKFLAHDSTVRIDIELGKTSQHHKNGDIFKAEVHIVGKHRNIYVTAETADLYASIDKVRDEAIQRVSASKDKRLSIVRKGGARVKSIIKGFFGRNENAEAETGDTGESGDDATN